MLNTAEMIDIAICIFGIIGFVVCEIIESIMWEKDREKALDYDFKQADHILNLFR